MSLNLYRQYAAASPWNSRTRREWLEMAAIDECNSARRAGRDPQGHAEGRDHTDGLLQRARGIPRNL